MASAAGGRPGERSSRDIRLTVQEAAKKLSLWHTATFRPIMTHDDLEPILARGGGRKIALRGPELKFPLLGGPKRINRQFYTVFSLRKLGSNANFRILGGAMAPAGPPLPPPVILADAGFVALPLPPNPPTQDQQVRWREYAFLGCGGGGCGGSNAVVGWLGPRPRLPYPRVDALHIRTYQAFLGAVEVYLGAARVPNLFHVRCMPVTTKQDRVFDKVFRAMRNDQDGIIVYRDGTLDDATFAAVCSEHTPIEDVGYHVIPGNACSELRFLRHGKIHGGNCNEETCNGYPGYI